jgi:hypothetical protein
MTGIVLPAIATPVAVTDVGAIAATDVRVSIEAIVAVNRNIVVPAPTGSPTPTSAPGGSHSYPNTK